MEKKAMIGAVMAIIAVILVGVTLITPWYNVHFTTSGSFMGVTYEGKGDMDAYLNHYEMRTSATTGGQTQTQSLNSGYEEDSETSKVFNNTMILVVLTLIFGILAIIVALLVAFGNLKPKIGALLILPMIIFAFITPLYLMGALPPAIGKESGSLTGSEGEFFNNTANKMSTQFFGSDHIEYNSGYVSIPMDFTWGGAIAWFLSFIAGIIGIIAMIFVFLSKSEVPGPYSSMYTREYPPEKSAYEHPQFPEPPTHTPEEDSQENIQRF